MKLKYCPKCVGLSIDKNHVGQDTCGKCGYTGDMSEGGIDEINSRKKKLNSESHSGEVNGNGIPSMFMPKSLEKNADSPSPENQPKSELSERLKKLKGTSTDNYEFL